jgi:hypothetical protein
MPYTTRARWCVTADHARLVPETDPAAAYLLAPAGVELPDSVARRYGLPALEEALRASPVLVMAEPEVQAREDPPAHTAITRVARKDRRRV